MKVDYVIISKPDYIQFNCPHCKAMQVQTGFSNVDFKTDYWGDGALVDCPICGKEVELGNYDYE